MRIRSFAVCSPWRCLGKRGACARRGASGGDRLEGGEVITVSHVCSEDGTGGQQRRTRRRVHAGVNDEGDWAGSGFTSSRRTSTR